MTTAKRARTASCFKVADDATVADYAPITVKDDQDKDVTVSKKITVTAYAVQADGFDDAEAAWTATPSRKIPSAMRAARPAGSRPTRHTCSHSGSVFPPAPPICVPPARRIPIAPTRRRFRASTYRRAFGQSPLGCAGAQPRLPSHPAPPHPFIRSPSPSPAPVSPALYNVC